MLFRSKSSPPMSGGDDLVCKAADRIDELEAALREIVDSSDDYDESNIAEKRCILALDTSRAILAQPAAKEGPKDE